MALTWICLVRTNLGSSGAGDAEGGEAPDFTEPLKSALVAEGGAVLLQAKVAGSPAPAVTWFKVPPCPILTAAFTASPWVLAGQDGVKLEGGEAGEDGLLSLRIPAVGQAETGEYRVEAANALGTVWSDATVSIQRQCRLIPPHYLPYLSLLLLFVISFWNSRRDSDGLCRNWFQAGVHQEAGGDSSDAGRSYRARLHCERPACA